MTPGEEEIMRIYEDRIYCPLDMIEKQGCLHIEGYSIRDVKAALCKQLPITLL